MISKAQENSLYLICSVCKIKKKYNNNRSHIQICEFKKKYCIAFQKKILGPNYQRYSPPP